MKFFISQPMRGRSDEDIINERKKIASRYPSDEMIDSFIPNVPSDSNPMFYLGESIKRMSEANFVVFAQGWQNANGCLVEHVCAEMYNMHIVYDYD